MPSHRFRDAGSSASAAPNQSGKDLGRGDGPARPRHARAQRAAQALQKADAGSGEDDPGQGRAHRQAAGRHEEERGEPGAHEAGAGGEGPGDQGRAAPGDRPAEKAGPGRGREGGGRSVGSRSRLAEELPSVLSPLL